MVRDANGVRQGLRHSVRLALATDLASAVLFNRPAMLRECGGTGDAPLGAWLAPDPVRIALLLTIARSARKVERVSRVG